jgi:GNAT superfamily N-acetyltransferase
MAVPHNESMRPLPAGICTRRAGPGDVDAVTALVIDGLKAYREWAPADWVPPPPTPEQRERLRANFGNDDAWILMALDGDELVAVASMAGRTAAHADPPPPGTIYLWQMFVRPGWQGAGLAQALMDLALAEARERGYERMTLWAAAGATQARRFYERGGWTVSGHKDDVKFGLPLVQYERGTSS